MMLSWCREDAAAAERAEGGRGGEEGRHSGPWRAKEPSAPKTMRPAGSPPIETSKKVLWE